MFFETKIMGKTADLAMIQKTIIDTLHKEGKGIYFKRSSFLFFVWGQKEVRKDWATVFILSSKADSDTWESFTRCGRCLRRRRVTWSPLPILDFWGPYAKLCHRWGGGWMKRICPCFTPSRIVLTESARETVSSAARYAFNSFFFSSNKRLYDIHVTWFDWF